MHVITKSCENEPLLRLLTGKRGNLAYVVNPSVVDKMDIDEFSGVGFPAEAVFEFDKTLYESLASAWESGDQKRLAAH